MWAGVSAETALSFPVPTLLVSASIGLCANWASTLVATLTANLLMRGGCVAPQRQLARMVYGALMRIPDLGASAAYHPDYRLDPGLFKEKDPWQLGEKLLRYLDGILDVLHPPHTIQ